MKSEDYAELFTVLKVEQRSREWFEARVGVPTASRLGDLLDVVKSGAPSARSKSYKRQLAYERLVGAPFEVFETAAMRDGTHYEELVAQLYAGRTGYDVSEAYSLVSDKLIVTPDRVVATPGGEAGLMEAKVMGDNSFSDLVTSGQRREHFLQCQAQMMATGVSWIDYVAVNLKSGRMTILRVDRDDEVIADIYQRVFVEPLDLPDINPTVELIEFDTSLVDKYDADQLKGGRQESRVDSAGGIDLPF